MVSCSVIVSVFVIVIVLSSLRFSNLCLDCFGRGCAVKECQMEEKKGAQGLDFWLVGGVFFDGELEVGGSCHIDGGWSLILSEFGESAVSRSESGILVSSVVGDY